MSEENSGERVAVLMSRGLVGRMFTEGDWAELLDLGAGIGEPGERGLDAVGPRTEVIVTGWDSPPLTESVLDGAGSLRLIGHTGAAIHAIIPPSVYERGIAVSTVAHVLAEAVAEYTVMAMIAGLRRLTSFHGRLQRGDPWEGLAAEPPGRLLRAQTVGLVGASRVGRATMVLLKAFGCQILLADPFVSAEQAAELGVELVPLRVLLASSDVVSLHAPLLPSTRGMIGAAELSLMSDGALLVNTARGPLVVENALLVEVRSGRLTAVLDVFDEEPLPVGSPWRGLERAIITPHIAALTRETLHAQGRTVLDEILRHQRGEPPVGGISRELYGRIA